MDEYSFVGVLQTTLVLFIGITHLMLIFQWGRVVRLSILILDDGQLRMESTTMVGMEAGNGPYQRKNPLCNWLCKTRIFWLLRL